MDIETKYTDLTFFTNDSEDSILDRFKSVLKTVGFFDIFVGYFRISGFHQLYKSFEKIEKIRILVGLNIDKKKLNGTMALPMQMMNIWQK